MSLGTIDSNAKNTHSVDPAHITQYRKWEASDRLTMEQMASLCQYDHPDSPKFADIIQGKVPMSPEVSELLLDFVRKVTKNGRLIDEGTMQYYDWLATQEYERSGWNVAGKVAGIVGEETVCLQQ